LREKEGLKKKQPGKKARGRGRRLKAICMAIYSVVCTKEV
jgi:hypothetical protein